VTCLVLLIKNSFWGIVSYGRAAFPSIFFIRRPLASRKQLIRGALRAHCLGDSFNFFYARRFDRAWLAAAVELSIFIVVLSHNNLAVFAGQSFSLFLYD